MNYNLDQKEGVALVNLLRLFLHNNKNGTNIQVGDVILDSSNPMPVITPGTTSLSVIADVPDMNKLESYVVSDLEEGETTYAGFIRPDGKWYIMKITSTSVRYFNGDTDYATNWNNRINLAFAVFNTLTW